MRASQMAFIGVDHPVQDTIDRFLVFDNLLPKFGLIGNLSHFGVPMSLLHWLTNSGPEARRRELIAIWQQWIGSPDFETATDEVKVIIKTWREHGGNEHDAAILLIAAQTCVCVTL